MSIPEKDLKILWGKAAGRCSICRNNLFHEADNPSDTTLIGENCHIVAEKVDGPRGQSNLELADRNRYPNLILLCRNHHKIIDDDYTTYSIPILYKIKTDHELWIQNSFEVNSTPDKEYYMKFINEISISLRFSNWEAISDHLIRLILPVYFESAVRDFGAKVFKANWPKKYPELENKIINLSERFNLFLDFYRSNSELRDKYWGEDLSWRRNGWVVNFQDCSAEASRWKSVCSNLLFNVVHALNEFSDQVRKDIDTNFLLHEGKFIVCDSMGVTNDSVSMRYLPERYIDVEINPIVIEPIYRG